jgi:nuclear mRNA export protein PCID2/THP1
MGTPYLGQFINAVNGFIQHKNESSLADYLVIEPPFGEHYQHMIRELKQSYPKGKEEELEGKCAQFLKAAREGADGAPWTAFIKFMAQYLGYLRDVDADPNKYLETYNLLSELQARANSALAHGSLGYLILPTVISCARLVCRLAIGLDKQPQLIAHLKSQQAGSEDGGARETLPERAANILRQAFVTCLNDRTPVKTGEKPEGRKRGIYIIANICLKILFQCRKTRNATQIFENIGNLSPPLSSYSKRERVTYLYYLGRFYFQNSHFYRAQLALQQAYDDSPARRECVRQRRHILVYLIASNIILGRFPSQALLDRPEAGGLAEKFMPICIAIRKGDLASFRRHLDINGVNANWHLHFRILLQLRNRCEVLVWRSLTRKIWILNGTRPGATEDGKKRTPTVNMHDLMAAFTWLDKRSNLAPADYVDPDFQGIDYSDDYNPQNYDITAIESILSSLIDQGLLGGFFSHRNQKFAITGTRANRPALEAGFPQPWQVMRMRAENERAAVEVPGWKKEQIMSAGAFGAGPGPGMVINLSNARAVGTFG